MSAYPRSSVAEIVAAFVALIAAALALPGCADLPAQSVPDDRQIEFTFEPAPPSPGPAKPGPSPTPLPEPAAGPVVPVQPFPIPERTELPEIGVDVWFGPRCHPCDRLMAEMKRGNGRRRIAWTWRDHSFPAASIVDGEARIPYIEWTARGTRWNFRGFLTREELEARIARTESGR